MNRISKNFNFIVSLLLCSCIIINSSYFRKVTHANAAVVIQYTPEAVAVIGGLLASMGIEVSSSDEIKQLWTDYVYYCSDPDTGPTVQEMTRTNMLGGEALVATQNDDGSITLGVNPKYGFTGVYDPSAGTFKHVAPFTNADEYLKYIEDVTGGGSGGGDDGGDNGGDNNNNTPTWKRVIAGIMASATAVTSVGNSFYDFLHANGQQLADDSAMSFAIGNIDDLNAAFKSFIKANTSLSTSDFDWVERHISSGGNVSLNRFNAADVVAYDIYKSNPYYYCYYRWGYNFNDSDPAGGSYAYTKYETWYVVGKRSDNTYVICNGFTPSFNYNANGSFSSSSIYSNTVVNTRFSSVSDLESYMCSQSSNASDKATTNNQRFAYRGSVSAADGNAGLRCHYAVDQTATEITAPDNTEQPKKLKVGDTTVTIPDTTPNVYDDPAGWQDVVEADASSDGKVLVVSPKVNPDTGEVVYPDTGNKKVFNPDDTEAAEDPQLDDESYQNQNIFQLLYNFFSNFFKRLEQVVTRSIKTALNWAFVPPDGYFEDKINELRIKHCSSAGTIHFDELEIPDIYWYPEGSSLDYYIKADKVLIVSNAFLRQHINTFRLLITSFLYFLWLLNKLNHILRFFGVVNPNNLEQPTPKVININNYSGGRRPRGG